jgi:uncharacterized membrane-anchored protein
VNRDINNPALNFLRSSAYVGGVDFGHRFAGNVYKLLLASIVGFAHRAATRSRFSVRNVRPRYYQRPDLRVARYDSK